MYTKHHLSLLLFVSLLLLPVSHAFALQNGFSYVSETVPGAVIDVRYFGANNFVGEPIDGYTAPRVILTTAAAEALAKVQMDLAPFGLGLKVFDGYRPQRAVDHFVRWGKDLTDTRMKAQFYPDVDKKDLFKDGYIAEKSGHSRGSTVDLTIIDLASGKALDMGTPFDFFGPKSWPANRQMSPQVRANRGLLRAVMARHGFKPLKEEWWHFTLKQEPFPDTYFDFPIQ